MFISEVFYSVQGEGSLLGVPSVFIRTSGCNLRCRWCDTPYASWQPEGTERSLDDLLAEVQSHPARHVVLTGGEPMIAPQMPELLARLHAGGYHLTIETAGTVPPAATPCHLASLSPKLAHSTPDAATAGAGAGWVERHQRLRLQPAILRQWCEQSVDYQLKFVATQESDLEEIQQLIHAIGIMIPPHHIMLMPEGITAETLRGKQSWLVEACKRLGWRYTPRLHIDLFGNRRGT
jgi:7-carboxy-7-deazaguanine synthase